MVYDYPKSELDLKVQLVAEKLSFKRYRVSFPSNVRTGEPRNDEASGIYFEPRLIERPPAVLLHSWLTNRLIMPLYTHIARGMARNGIPSFLLTFPYHVERTPRGRFSGAAFLSPDPSRTLESFQQAVVDIRCSLDWLKMRAGWDEFSIVGISLGALVASITMGVDKRIKRGVFILGGGDVGEILWRGLATLILKKKARITAEKNRWFHEEYESYLRRIRTLEDLERLRPADDSFLFDPLTYARFIRGRKVLMINAKFDHIIPRRSILRLWHGLEEPQIIWLSSTHITSIFWLGFIQRKTIEFLRDERV